MATSGRTQATGAGKASLSPKFASLGPLLLARKGTAKPAMRAQLGDDARGNDAAALNDCAATDTLTSQIDAAGADLAPELSQDDLGWNDMGDDALILPPAEPEVKRQQALLVHRIADANSAALNHASGADDAAAQAAARRAAFTLRLDEERHLRLRLASTVNGTSAQNLVTRALDEFLARHPHIEHLAAQVRKPA